jgi:predicted oxidoreductase
VPELWKVYYSLAQEDCTMTQHETSKCEKLLYEAIKIAEQSREEFEIIRQCFKNDDMYGCERNQRKSDRHWGHAEGVFYVLKELGFEHRDMKRLQKLIKW